ncbi:hypothetical protein [Effusibacillus pohliae]|uniref:hypothetical protein n=1 Tax=Effusibacillus pohliae TaxID=232270 RepID=UPI00036D03A4|nr:hypothetical protein [Effusibacillus pohliae]
MSIVITEELWWPLPEWIRAKYQVMLDPELYRDRERIAAIGANVRPAVDSDGDLRRRRGTDHLG